MGDMEARKNHLFDCNGDFIPGVCGLSNLGNACFINSVLQALGHLEVFRDFFRHFEFAVSLPSDSSLCYSSSDSCYADVYLLNKVLICKEVCRGDKNLLLCFEMCGLLQVLWSGRWAQISPKSFLKAVGRTIPAFKDHLQHDAQEFLCELLDRIAEGIEGLLKCKGVKNVIDEKFTGKFVSEVTCFSCSNIFRCYEPFLSISLEFPSSEIHGSPYQLKDLLSLFSSVEDLEPSSYVCGKCNGKGKRSSAIRTDAKKQLLVSRAPDVLILHLKRFRWSGQNKKGKICTRVVFDEVLDIRPFCKRAPSMPLYRLNAVVMHHGLSHRAGHYTAFVYNNSTRSWFHCNDSTVGFASKGQVLASQAYILFYTKKSTTDILKRMLAPAKSAPSKVVTFKTPSTPDGPPTRAGNLEFQRNLRGCKRQVENPPFMSEDQIDLGGKKSKE